MKKDSLLIIANLVGGICLLQLPAKNSIGTHNSIWSEYGFPFTFFTRHWSCDWLKGWQHATKIDYGVSFSYIGLFADIAVAVAVAAAVYYIANKIWMSKPAWQRRSIYTYIVTSLALFLTNVYFVIHHAANTQTMKNGRYESGWPIPIFSEFLASDHYGVVFYANIWNALIFILTPLVLIVGLEKLTRRDNREQNKQGLDGRQSPPNQP